LFSELRFKRPVYETDRRAWVPVTAFLTWLAYRTYSHED
jgi:hypothetical protein